MTTHNSPSGTWLVKSEPETYSWSDLVRDKRTEWTGVRNFAARLHLRAMQVGDEVFVYHSGDEKSIVGIARVSKSAFPDKTADEDGWVAVALAAVNIFGGFIVTQRMLSMILLFPQPLGPITPVMPSSKWRVVLSAKLLNPLISKLFKRTVLSVF